MPLGLIVFGIGFAALIAVAGILKAHRTKQRIYHLSTLAGMSMILFFALAFFGQFILAFVLIIIIGALSYVTLPWMFKVREKELMEKMEETDESSPITKKDFFSDALWVKLIARWGLTKSLSVIYLSFLIGIGGVLWATSLFYTFITPTFIVVYTLTFSSLSIILLYVQIRKVAEKTRVNKKSKGRV